VSAQGYWTDWTSGTAGAGGGAIGTLAIPGQATITVTYTGNNLEVQSAPNGFDYWRPRPPATACGTTPVAGCDPWLAPSLGISNPVTAGGTANPDIIRLFGGPATGTQTVTFSTAIANPIFAILSLGQPGVTVTYDFNRPFEILSFGPSASFGGPGTLTAISDPATNSFRLTGVEGNGLIRFLGDFQSISWTVPVAENWHGFTIGVQGVAAGEPSTVPEPATLGLVALGLGGLAAVRRRIRRGS
jgi:hypothetical protein